MPRDLDRLVVSPLFYDALNGEFKPRADRFKRAHTLARLSVATFIKGGETLIDENIREFTYSPSWLPTVEAQVVGINESGSDKIRFTSLTLEDKRFDAGQVHFQDAASEHDVNYLLIVDDNAAQGEREVTYPLELGRWLDLARGIATLTARHFFEQASQKTVTI